MCCPSLAHVQHTYADPYPMGVMIRNRCVLCFIYQSTPWTYQSWHLCVWVDICVDESFCLGFSLDSGGRTQGLSHTLNPCSRDIPTAQVCLFVCFETMSLVCTNFKISKPSFGFSLLSYFHRWLTVFVKNSWNETIWKGKRE